jgi:hypothetical protein
MREVDDMQGEVDDMKKTVMEPIQEIEAEAAEELRTTQAEMSKGLEGTEEIKKGLRALVDQSKKGMAQAREEARLEEAKQKGQMPPNRRNASGQRYNAAHIAKGNNVGLLGRQAPGSSRRGRFGAKPNQQAQNMRGRQAPQMQQNQRDFFGRKIQPRKQQSGVQRPQYQQRPREPSYMAEQKGVAKTPISVSKSTFVDVSKPREVPAREEKKKSKQVTKKSKPKKPAKMKHKKSTKKPEKKQKKKSVKKSKRKAGKKKKRS